MFGLNKAVLGPILNMAKTKIQKEGIKTIYISADEKGDMNIKAFKNSMYVITEAQVLDILTTAKIAPYNEVNSCRIEKILEAVKDQSSPKNSISLNEQ